MGRVSYMTDSLRGVQLTFCRSSLCRSGNADDGENIGASAGAGNVAGRTTLVCSPAFVGRLRNLHLHVDEHAILERRSLTGTCLGTVSPYARADGRHHPKSAD